MRKHKEVEFLIEKDGAVLPIEVKSGKHYRSHASLNALMANPDYGIPRAIVASNFNISTDEEKRIDYWPVYFLDFLTHDALPENTVYEIPGLK